MKDLSSALAVLSAMITPAVLISACGSLILATSNRLSRVLDRTRKVAERFEELSRRETDKALLAEEQKTLFEHLRRATNRTLLLQRALATLYIAVSVFVFTSIAIGVVAVVGQRHAWLPISLGLIGAGLLFTASLILIAESRIALASVEEEMEFVLQVGRHYAPSELLELMERRRPRRRWLRRDSENER